MVDVRAATVIDLLYAIILYIFKIENKVPMVRPGSCWLAGREIAMTWAGVAGKDRTMSA